MLALIQKMNELMNFLSYTHYTSLTVMHSMPVWMHACIWCIYVGGSACVISVFKYATECHFLCVAVSVGSDWPHIPVNKM